MTHDELRPNDYYLKLTESRQKTSKSIKGQTIFRTSSQNLLLVSLGIRTYTETHTKEGVYMDVTTFNTFRRTSMHCKYSTGAVSANKETNFSGFTMVYRLNVFYTVRMRMVQTRYKIHLKTTKINHIKLSFCTNQRHFIELKFEILFT